MHLTRQSQTIRIPAIIGQDIIKCSTGGYLKNLMKVITET